MPASDPAGHGQPTPDNPDEPMLDKYEVAARLGGGKITGKTVIRRHKKWGLHPVKVGRELRWKRGDVEKWIDKNQQGPQQ